MLKVAIRPVWSILRDDGEISIPRLLGLLKGVDEVGSLAEASKSCGLSYRHAWGLLRDGQRLFGSPLIVMEKGRGSRLAPLGEALVWADRRIGARLGPLLDSLATELEAEIERRVFSVRAILHIHASHGFAVETLRRFMIQAQLPAELKYRTSLESVAALASGSCDVAGFHIPTGEFEARALLHYGQWLDPHEMLLINVVTRRQGLMVAHGNPKKIYSLSDLVRDDVEFINRQQGSGTRLLLDMMLAREDIEARSIRGFENCEYTHAAVAAFVASDKADAAFGVETPARQFNLEFMPLQTERYFVACRRDSLASPLIERMLQILRSPEYEAAIRVLPGYVPNRSGSVVRIAEAFASLAGVK